MAFSKGLVEEKAETLEVWMKLVAARQRINVTTAIFIFVEVELLEVVRSCLLSISPNCLN